MSLIKGVQLPVESIHKIRTLKSSISTLSKKPIYYEIVGKHFLKKF